MTRMSTAGPSDRRTASAQPTAGGRQRLRSSATAAPAIFSTGGAAIQGWNRAVTQHQGDDHPPDDERCSRGETPPELSLRCGSHEWQDVQRNQQRDNRCDAVYPDVGAGFQTPGNRAVQDAAELSRAVRSADGRSGERAAGEDGDPHLDAEVLGGGPGRRPDPSVADREPAPRQDARVQRAAARFCVTPDFTASTIRRRAPGPIRQLASIDIRAIL